MIILTSGWLRGGGPRLAAGMIITAAIPGRKRRTIRQCLEGCWDCDCSWSSRCCKLKAGASCEVRGRGPGDFRLSLLQMLRTYRRLKNYLPVARHGNFKGLNYKLPQRWVAED
jgi:hypothetical protein